MALDRTVARTAERTVERTRGRVGGGNADPIATMGFRSVPKTLLRDRLRGELASLGDDALLITDRGRAIAVVVSVVRWNQLQDILDELQARLMILERQAEGRGAWERLLSELD